MARLGAREKQPAQMTAVKEGREMNRACYKQFTLLLNPVLSAELDRQRGCAGAVVRHAGRDSFKPAVWDKLALIRHLLRL